MKKSILFSVLVLCGINIFAQQPSTPDTLRKPIQICPDQIVWLDSKPPLPAGAKVAVLEGDPKKDGIFVMRLKFPANYYLPAHIHPKDERVLVISGSVNVGFGDKIDKKNITHYTAGCFYVNPAGLHHYVFTEEDEVIVQLTGIGPWGLEFVGGKK